MTTQQGTFTLPDLMSLSLPISSFRMIFLYCSSAEVSGKPLTQFRGGRLPTSLGRSRAAAVAFGKGVQVSRKGIDRTICGLRCRQVEWRLLLLRPRRPSTGRQYSAQSKERPQGTFGLTTCDIGDGGYGRKTLPSSLRHERNECYF